MPRAETALNASSTAAAPLHVNGTRLNEWLTKFDSIGRTPTGINRVAYSEADLAGLPRTPVIVGFVGFSLLTFVYMPDFLSVRALAVIMLFLARHALDAGYRQLPQSLLAASVSYGVLVLFGFWWACSPPVFCRQCDWVLATDGRRKVVGGLSLLLAAACVVQSFRLS